MQKTNGWVLWFVGLPGSGKSALAGAVQRALEERGVTSVLLQMDQRRKTYFPAPTYSSKERDHSYTLFAREAAELAALGDNVIMDGTAPKRAMRRAARRLIDRFAEVHVKCSLETAMDREAARPEGHAMTGLYRKALERKRTGRQFEGLGDVIGVDTPFEEDPDAECVVDNEHLTLYKAVDQVMAFFDAWRKGDA